MDWATTLIAVQDVARFSAFQLESISFTLLFPRGSGRISLTPGRLERTAPLRFSTATPANCDGLMREFFSLHSSRWHSREEPGVLAQKELSQFHCAVARCFAERGLLRLNLLHLAGKPVAAFYGFQCARSTFLT